VGVVGVGENAGSHLRLGKRGVLFCLELGGGRWGKP